MALTFHYLSRVKIILIAETPVEKNMVKDYMKELKQQTYQLQLEQGALKQFTSLHNSYM
jgi:hypothetical protein